MSRYFTKKLRVVESADFREFACVLEGVLEKRVFACGAFVVILWTSVWQTWIGKLVLLGCKKWDSDFDFIFGLTCSAEASRRMRQWFLLGSRD
jgi:hypothetical protein